MKLRKNDKPQWFFMWTKGSPYITTVCSWTRALLIQEVQTMFGQSWGKTYRQGGRAVKCEIMLKEQP